MVFYRTPVPIIVYYFPYITCLLHLLFHIFIFYFFVLFYSHLTPHSPPGMAGSSQRLTNTCAADHHGSLYKRIEQTIGPKATEIP